MNKLFEAALLLAAHFAAYDAEAPRSTAQYAIIALACSLLFSLHQRKSSTPKAILGLWALLAFTWLIPFLPGQGSAYPPTRFLVVLGAAGFFSTMNRWGILKFNAICATGFMLWMVLLTGRSWEIYKRLGYGYDLAHILNILENTSHGRFLYSDYTNGSILSHHLFLTLALLAPLTQLAETNFLPQMIQIALMGGSVLVMTWAATKKYGHSAGAAAFFSMLLHPAFQGQTLHEFDPAVIGTFSLSCAILGYCMERRGLLWVGALGAMLSKEHFVIAGILAGAVMIRNNEDTHAGSRKDGMGLAALGIILIAGFGAYSLFFGGPLNISEQFTIRFGQGGGSPVALIAEAFRPSKLGYLIHMLLPSGGLALLSWPLLLPALPELLLNMTSRFPMHHLSTHYSSLSLPFLAIATAHTIGYFTSKNAAHGRWAAKYVVVASLLSAIFSNLGPISHTGAFYDVLLSPRDWRYRSLDALVSRMPPGTVGVRGNHRLLIYFENRKPAIDLHYIDTSELMNTRDLLVYDDFPGPPPEGYQLIDSDGATKVYKRIP